MTLSNQDTFSTDRDLLEQNILNSLSGNPGDFTAQCRNLQPFLKETKQEACKIILDNLVQLNFTLDNASKYWDAIVDHAQQMRSSLNREIGLATAACDYFSTVRPYLNNPKLIEFKRFEETIRSAHCDYLTGLLSRGPFQNSLEQEISRARRHGHHTTLIFFDLDNFKDINDHHGHLAGDAALTQIGKILLHSKRKEDIACRFGGDEFVLLLPETNKFMGSLVGKKILKQINSLTVLHEGKKIPIACSAGLAAYPLDSQNVRDLINCADQAMYRAKTLGKHELLPFEAEKRVFTRIDFNDIIIIEAKENEGPSDSTTAKNISEGGILISSKNSYDLGCRLVLRIPLKKERELTITGSVVRVEQFDTDLFDIGLNFLHHKSSAISTQAIANYIAEHIA
jgi:diguanylate cyclase (GGDEF)-like protein